ncbi:MazG-like family protein [Streptomyces sp. NPDC008343]|uniref:MazG-like family protein n=1 Tax=Streptomyces sp. NPDC008343 TaxID=3364828 RepID=UPI0036E78BE1
MSAVLWPVTARIVTALNTANGTGEHETAMRLMKVIEEAGEASAAYIGVTGQNPRKGVTHTAADVADELCDVIIAAAVALHAFTGTPPAVLDAKLHAAARRLHADSPQQAYTLAPPLGSELDWTSQRFESTPHSHGLNREYRLREAALLDRLALQGGSDNDAAEAARRLIELDAADVTDDPRAYVRQQYARYTHTRTESE